jgi:outer membrane lipoprotein carrier protein
MNPAPGHALLTGLLLWALCLPGARAETPALVQQFFSNLHTLQADFDQQVMDSNNQPLQSSQGHMWIMRPGRFRWDYETPYRQQLVADGERLWSYDEDLEQVTVQAAAEVLTATPAMLLSGDQPLEEVFNIHASSPESVQLTPKSDDSNVTGLQLYFAGGLLQRIEAQDTFGNTTTFSFFNLERNPELPPALFRFEPPAGADVVGEID